MNTFGVLFLIAFVGVVAYIARWIWRVQRVVDSHDTEVQKHAGESDGGRWGRPQIAGEDCALCEKTLVFEDDGARCRKCKSVVHRQCFGKHECTEGAPDGTTKSG